MMSVLRIPALLWLCLWFGLIVPAHQRGQVVRAGTCPDAQAGMTVTSGCCSTTPAPSAAPKDSTPDGRKKPAQPSEQRVRCCAVCYIAATTQPTTEIRFVPPPFYLLAVLPPVPLSSLLGVDRTPDPRGRDPPAAPLLAA